MDTSEKNFEAAIEATLLRDPLAGGEKGVVPLLRSAYVSGHMA